MVEAPISSEGQATTNPILAPDRQALTAGHGTRPVVHHPPEGFSARVALGFTKRLRFSADIFFARR